jgi:hypothetical protein
VDPGDGGSTDMEPAGIRGGATQLDRGAGRRLPIDEAAREARTFPERLARRVAAFQAHSNGRPPTRHAREVRRVLTAIFPEGMARTV